MMRALLPSLTFAAFLLGGCVNGQFSVGAAANDADAIATGLAQAVKDLRTGNALSAAQMAQIDTALADVQATSAALAKAASQTQAQSLATQIAGDVNAIVAAASAIPTLPPPVPEVLAAADVMLPVLEADVGIQAPLGAAPGMSVAQARALLAAQAAKFRAGA